MDCRLRSGCRSPCMPVTGEGRGRILVVAEAPGEQEDQQNTQLIGPAGKVLRVALRGLGVELDWDCRKTNAVRCRPPKNRRPEKEEIAACAPHLWEEIRARPPKVIILLGDVALRSFLLGRRTPESISQFRGFPIPDQKAGCWVVATFHPSYILRMKEGRSIRGKDEPPLSPEEMIFRRDLALAVRLAGEPFPVQPKPMVVEDWMINKGMEIAIDYETTGLRPWAKGHRIISYGLSNGKWCAASPMTLEAARAWKVWLSGPAPKIAHNMKFEHQWAARCLGVETRGWVWDTMLAAHVLDNRSHVTSLKLAAYLALGVEDWSREVKDSLKGSGEFNSLKDVKIPDRKLLQYNALDAYWTKRLADWQRRQFK